MNGMREFGGQTLVHGKEAGSENNGVYLRVRGRFQVLKFAVKLQLDH